ncbi:MAG: metallophosphoesterase family protein [Candidatus Omnitrophica bacterium]|nr:metallophosphoesterase family protein [Candidatus Omnitrophota bacterium]
MRYGIFSDIHANWDALDAVVKALETEAIDAYLCVGDIVGYGANPNECIEKVKVLASVCVSGNHDWASIGFLGTEWFNPDASEVVRWTKQQLQKEAVLFLKSCELLFENDDLTLVHGTLDSPQEFKYMYSGSNATATLGFMKTKICFVGHTHIAGVFVKDGDNRLHYGHQSRVTLKDNARYIVNVGSVGQPRDGNPDAAYCVYDAEKSFVEIKRVSYDVSSQREKIIAAGLPPFLGDRLLRGV